MDTERRRQDDEMVYDLEKRFDRHFSKFKKGHKITLGKKYPNRKKPIPFTKEHRESMSKTRKRLGIKPPSFKGKKRNPFTEEHKEKIRIKSMGRIPWNKGKMKQTDSRIVQPWLGKKRLDMIGHKWNKNKTRTEEFKKNLSEKLKEQHKNGKRKEVYKKLKGINKGEKNSQWRGGISNNPYSTDWTKTFRQSIRERDKYLCQLCKEKQGDKAHAVHHIDYDKENSNPNNLVTLCHLCHMKTNKDRDYWMNYFNNI